MKTFIAYRFSGEDPKELEPLLTAVCDAFNRKGIEAYCTLFDEQKFRENSYTRKQILDHAFKIIDKADFLFVLQTSDNKSEGMLVEIGYSLAKGLPIASAVKGNVQKTIASDVASVKIPWVEVGDLIEAIQEFEFTGLRHSMHNLSTPIA